MASTPNPSYQLAARLRQSVQGCCAHIHGPVQAWLQICTAGSEGTVNTREVAEIVVADCRRRLRDLKSQGVLETDARVVKELSVIAFVSALFSGRLDPSEFLYNGFSAQSNEMVKLTRQSG